ncbi:hypothetical protein [Streptomyces sp. NBC_00059]|uniref:hypothetical protein n=1 Tax=Streptomyces sp. NBC_00059 TaxID=2975635 RepID=UPI00225A3F14|nr:hypothetical protein [Streptomyces sp. NBC_00059]MCX5417803.1 hypothetical protein [Streptomyces sp. NBC_00059]
MMRYQPDVDHSLPEALLHVLREGDALPEALRHTVFRPPLRLAGAEEEYPGETHIVRGID